MDHPITLRHNLYRAFPLDALASRPIACIIHTLANQPECRSVFWRTGLVDRTLGIIADGGVALRLGGPRSKLGSRQHMKQFASSGFAHNLLLHSPDLNLTALAAFYVFCRAQRGSDSRCARQNA